MKFKERGKAEGGIGRGELFSLCLCLPLGGIVFSDWSLGAGGVRSWAAALLVALAVWGGLVMYIDLFAGQCFGEVFEYAFGRSLGRIAIFCCALLWLILSALGGIYAVLLWQALGAVGVSRLMYLLLFLLTAAIFAAAGAEPLARVALLVIVPSLLLVLGNLWLTMRSADWGNLLPVTEDGVGIYGGIWGGLLMFGTGAAILPLAKYVREPKRRRGTILSAWVLAAAVAAVLALGMKVVLSVSVGDYRFPLLQVFRLAEVGDWFSRFEVIGAGLLVVILLMRSAAMLCSAVNSLCYLWQAKAQGIRYIVAVGAAVGLWAAVMIVGTRLGDWWNLLIWCGNRLAWAMLLCGVVIPWAAVICGGIKYRNDNKTVLISHDKK